MGENRVEWKCVKCGSTEFRNKTVRLAGSAGLRELKPKDLGRIRDILLGVSAGYYERLKAASKAYVKKGEFAEFVREASVEILATVLRRLAVLSQTKVYLLWQNPAF